MDKIEFRIRFDLDPFYFIIDVLVLLLLDIVLDIDLHCIYSDLICVLCFVLPSLCVAGFRSIDFRLSRAWCVPFMVAGGTRRLRGQTRRGPLGVCRESRRRVVDGTGRQSGRICVYCGCRLCCGSV